MDKIETFWDWLMSQPPTTQFALCALVVILLSTGLGRTLIFLVGTILKEVVGTALYFWRWIAAIALIAFLWWGSS